MKILVDTADVGVIKDLYELYTFDGVTTNPALLARIGGDPFEILKDIKNTIPKNSELHVQVVSTSKEEMILEADFILKELGDDTHIKVPVSKEGYKVIEELAKRGVKVTATAIFNNAQAILAAHCGAKYVAPYIHRINNKNYDGIETALSIEEILKAQSLPTNLLAAAFENPGQVMEILASGAESLTVAPPILFEIFNNILTEDAVMNFSKVFKTAFKKDNMLD